MTLISTSTVSSGVSAVSITSGINSTYDTYLFKFISIHGANATDFQINFSIDSGSNYNVTKTTTAISAYHGENDSTPNVYYIDSHDLAQSTAAKKIMGTIKNDNDYNIMFVAALGDSREFSSYLSGSGDNYSNYTLVTSSFQEVIGFKICNQNGLVSKGDLLCTADTAGYLMKQPSEYVITSFSGSNPVYEERQNINSFTVGKLMESCSFDSNGKVEGVYGYLYCG